MSEPRPSPAARFLREKDHRSRDARPGTLLPRERRPPMTRDRWPGDVHFHRRRRRVPRSLLNLESRSTYSDENRAGSAGAEVRSSGRPVCEDVSARPAPVLTEKRADSISKSGEYGSGCLHDSPGRGLQRRERPSHDA